MHPRAQTARVVMPQQCPFQQHLPLPPHQRADLLPQRRVLEELHVGGLVVRVDQLLDLSVAVREATGADAKVVGWVGGRVEDAFFRGGVGG